MPIAAVNENACVPGVFRVRMVSYDVVSAEHTTYRLEVTAPDGSFWFLNKRYSEVRCLHEQLRPWFGNRLPPMPGKRLFGNQDREFLARRAADLQSYLDGAMQLDSQAEHWALRLFLGIATATSVSASARRSSGATRASSAQARVGGEVSVAAALSVGRSRRWGKAPGERSRSCGPEAVAEVVSSKLDVPATAAAAAAAAVVEKPIAASLESAELFIKQAVLSQTPIGVVNSLHGELASLAITSSKTCCVTFDVARSELAPSPRQATQLTQTQPLCAIDAFSVQRRQRKTRTSFPSATPPEGVLLGQDEPLGDVFQGVDLTVAGVRPVPPVTDSWDWPLSRGEARCRVAIIDRKMMELEHDDRMNTLLDEFRAAKQAAVKFVGGNSQGTVAKCVAGDGCNCLCHARRHSGVSRPSIVSTRASCGDGTAQRRSRSCGSSCAGSE